MKKIISITFAVIMLCLTLGIAGCHSKLDCPICTKTIDSKYTDLLSFYKVINPGATDEFDSLYQKETKAFDTLDELKECVMDIKGLMFPDIPAYIMENNDTVSYRAVTNQDDEICGFYVYCIQKSDLAKSGDIISIMFYGGIKSMFALDSVTDMVEGLPPYEAWTDEFHGIKTDVEYAFGPHFADNPQYRPGHKTYINMGFTNDGVYHSVKLVVAP